MATNLELNNAGGRTLIGNYAEERHLAEQLGLQTNYNKGVELNASLEFSTVRCPTSGGRPSTCARTFGCASVCVCVLDCASMPRYF